MTSWIRSDGGMSAEGFKERADCAVRALALVTGMPYKDAHSKFKSLGRKNGRGTRNTYIDTVMTELNFVHDKGPRTVGQLLQKYRKGNVYVVVRGHAFAVIDGTIHDTFVTGAKSRILRCYVAPTTAASTPVVEDRLHSYQKREGALAAFNRLNDGVRSRYAIAKVVAAELGITLANANYYVRQF